MILVEIVLRKMNSFLQTVSKKKKIKNWTPQYHKIALGGFASNI